MFGMMPVVMSAGVTAVMSSPKMEWERAVCARATRIHAEMAELARELATGDEHGYWRGDGIRSCVDWVVIRTGFDRYNAEKLVSTGHAMPEMPAVAHAFEAGELSLEKARLVASVATARTEDHWTRVAREASPPELARMCREHHSRTTDDAERTRLQRARRSVRSWWDDLGMLQLHAALPPEDGAVVRNALERLGRTITEERTAPSDALEPAEDPMAALRADALVRACAKALDGRGDAGGQPSGVQMVVHVDLGVLTGETSEGRCHIDDGPAISREVARRLGCDAEVYAVVERNGSTVDVLRGRRFPNRRTRRFVQNRDVTCRVPGCSVAASRCVVHHIHYWSDGGSSRPWDLLTMCGSCHRRYHAGEFEIHRTPEGDLVFETPDGRLMGVATGGHWKRPRRRAGPPVRTAG